MKFVKILKKGFKKGFFLSQTVLEVQPNKWHGGWKWVSNFIKKETPVQVFSSEFCEIRVLIEKSIYPALYRIFN